MVFKIIGLLRNFFWNIKRNLNVKSKSLNECLNLGNFYTEKG